MEVKKYEEKIIKQKVEVSKSVYCDCCSKEITNSYWHLCTHHSDWGVDSVDSYSEFDLCSKECVQSKLDEYMEESDNNHNTKEFELEHINYLKNMRGAKLL